MPLKKSLKWFDLALKEFFQLDLPIVMHRAVNQEPERGI